MAFLLWTKNTAEVFPFCTPTQFSPEAKDDEEEGENFVHPRQPCPEIQLLVAKRKAELVAAFKIQKAVTTTINDLQSTSARRCYMSSKMMRMFQKENGA